MHFHSKYLNPCNLQPLSMSFPYLLPWNGKSPPIFCLEFGSHYLHCMTLFTLKETLSRWALSSHPAYFCICHVSLLQALSLFFFFLILMSLSLLNYSSCGRKSELFHYILLVVFFVLELLQDSQLSAVWFWWKNILLYILSFFLTFLNIPCHFIHRYYDFDDLTVKVSCIWDISHREIQC